MTDDIKPLVQRLTEALREHGIRNTGYGSYCLVCQTHLNGAERTGHAPDCLLADRPPPLDIVEDRTPEQLAADGDGYPAPQVGEQEIKRLRGVIERDRSRVASGIAALERAIGSRSWLRGGRGCYAWDDERYQAEFGQALDEIDEALKPLRKIAYDWSNCPTKHEDVIAARAAPQGEDALQTRS